MKTLVKRETPPSLISDFFDVDRFFDLDYPKWFTKTPAANITETDERFQIELAVPGFSKDKLKVSVENNMLILAGESTEEKKEENERYTRKEFSQSSFSRSFIIPDGVDSKSINAKFEDGLLRVSMPKTAEARNNHSRIIKVS